MWESHFLLLDIVFAITQVTIDQFNGYLFQLGRVMPCYRVSLLFLKRPFQNGELTFTLKVA